jgi:flagellar hook-associated protein 3 FlgL
MIQRYDPYGEGFLANLSRIQQRLAKASQQASSSLRVSAPSDAPEDVTDIVRLRSKMDQTAQVRQNLQSVKSEVDAAEGALQTAVKLVEKAIVNASEGASSISASRRPALGTEVRAILEQLVDTSRITVDGRYVFSGDSADSPSYEVDWNSATGVAQLQTATATRQVVSTHGSSFLTGQTAGDLFDARDANGDLAGDNVFAAVNNLRLALEQNDGDAIAASLTSLRQADEHLNDGLSFYGNLQERLTNEITVATNYEDQCRIWLGDKRDADLAAASVELAQLQTNQSAALSVQSKLPWSSLFDYLG